jgi:hypothetical protein
VQLSVHSEPSPRIRLARLAHDTALAVPGVAGLDAGPAGLFVSVAAGERIAGVRCVAAPEGGYDIALRLVCELVALIALADRVRAAIARAAAREGFEVQSVSIEIADIADLGVT